MRENRALRATLRMPVACYFLIAFACTARKRLRHFCMARGSSFPSALVALFDAHSAKGGLPLLRLSSERRWGCRYGRASCGGE